MFKLKLTETKTWFTAGLCVLCLASKLCLIFIIQVKTDDIARIYQPKRYALSPKSTITLAHLLAAREDLSKIIRTSSGSTRENTVCAINKVCFFFLECDQSTWDFIDLSKVILELYSLLNIFISFCKIPGALRKEGLQNCSKHCSNFFFILLHTVRQQDKLVAKM